MYIVQNAFGMIRVFNDYQLAENAYFEEVAFCGCVELKNAYTGFVLRASW